LLPAQFRVGLQSFATQTGCVPVAALVQRDISEVEQSIDDEVGSAHLACKCERLIEQRSGLRVLPREQGNQASVVGGGGDQMGVAGFAGLLLALLVCARRAIELALNLEHVPERVEWPCQEPRFARRTLESA